MRIIAVLAVVVGAIWAAKTGKLKRTSRLDDLRGRAKDLAGNATDDLKKASEDVVDRVKAHSH
jgi:uncharacterized protein YjbJ (UPF0337 family)